VATRFTRATGDCFLRRDRPRLLFFLEDDLEEDFRPALLRLEEAFLPPFRRGAFLALEDLRALDRFRPATLRRPLLRPEDLDRDLFLPPLRLLDFLAAAIGKLRVGGFVEPIARFAHNGVSHRRALQRFAQAMHLDHGMMRVSPCRMIHRSSLLRPAACHRSRIRVGGSSIGSSVSLKVPQ